MPKIENSTPQQAPKAAPVSWSRTPWEPHPLPPTTKQPPPENREREEQKTVERWKILRPDTLRSKPPELFR